MDELDNIEWIAKYDDTYRWVLNYNIIAVDVTKDFKSKYRITAYKFITDEMEEEIRKQIADGKFSINSNIKRKSATVPRRVIYGNEDDIPMHFGFPNWTWMATNCSRVGVSSNFNTIKSMIRKIPIFTLPPETVPYDGFQIEFTDVPYAILQRYWNRPVRLKSKWHTSGGKYSRTSQKTCGDVLRFNMASMKRKTIQANFESRHNQGNIGHHDPMWCIKTKAWVKNYIPVMRILTDQSPFVKDEHEFLFITEFL